MPRFAAKWLKSYPGDSTGFKPRMADVVTTDGLERMRHEHPEVYHDFIKAMNRKGTSNPKVVQPRAAYRGEIANLTDKQAAIIKEIG